MSKPAQKCYFYPKLFITFKKAYYFCFSLGGNLDFLDYLSLDSRLFKILLNVS